jgi:hypothetical protein
LQSRNSEIKRERQDFIDKVQSKHKKINEKYQEHQDLIVQAGDWVRQHNEITHSQVRQRQAHEKSVLTSIKERVYKTHTAKLLRRKRQLKEFAPPSTYEIYTTNQHSRFLRSNF